MIISNNFLILLGTCLTDINSFLTSPSTVWAPITLLIISVIILMLGVIYIVSPLIGRSEIKTWVRTKLYDELFTVVLIIIFVAFSVTLCTVHPASAYQSVGLISSSTRCDPLNSDIQGLDNFYGIATCDIWQFNQYVNSFSQSLFEVALVLSTRPTFDPNLNVNGIGFHFTISLLPIEPIHQYVVPIMGLYFGLVIISEFQVLIIGSAMILFPILMIIGIVARSFGISRSFGGSMIALALGIGFLYPLLISITYGFLDNSMETYGSITHLQITDLGNVVSEKWATSIITALFTWNLPDLESNLISAFRPFFAYAGFVVVGVGLVPLINLIILDAFVVDLSRVIGERIDFLSMLTRII